MNTPDVPAPAHASWKEHIKLSELLGFVDGVLLVVEQECGFNMEGVKEARKRLAAYEPPTPVPADEADARRLDWLEKHANFIEVGHGDISPTRQAIDAAMSADDGRKLPD